MSGSWLNQPLFGGGGGNDDDDNNDDNPHAHIAILRALSNSKLAQNVVTALIMFIPILFSSKARRFLHSRYARYELYMKFQLSKKKITKKDDDDRTTKKEVRVSKIFVYPVKSMKAVSLQRGEFDMYGLQHDRRFMVVRPCLLPNKGFFGPNDATHRFVTQRQAPSMATISCSLPALSSAAATTTSVHSSGHIPNNASIKSTTANHLALTYLDQKSGQTSSVTVDLTKEAFQQRKTIFRAGIWDDVVEVIDLGDPAATFIQQVLRFDVDQSSSESDDTGPQFTNVRLVYMSPKTYERYASKKYTPLSSLTLTGQTSSVSFCDGFPILIVSEASLLELNRRLAEKKKPPVTMEQFRPNIVVRGDNLLPFEEDTWKIIRIKDTIFHIVKGCPRCKQSCTNQTTGFVGEEPLVTLKEFRALSKTNNEVYFAQNALVQDIHQAKPIYVGDDIHVLEYGDPIYE